MPARLKELLLRQRRPLGRLKFTLESILVVAGIIALILAIWHHFDSQRPGALPGEGKRVVAFRQLANRICTESRQNQWRAQSRNASRVDRLGYSARAIGWDLRDLEGITAPPTRFDFFVAEVEVRAHAEQVVLALRGAIESGDGAGEAGALARLRTLETESHELSREAGIVRCMRILPPLPALVRP
jgi:hypothetical protein